ncbi:hypothetical protein MVEN_01037200 [Mycena venus]|uniref:Uncharacterized protein n=1 Tax=Mycena venus TaxID=2733690 RepID=A0A8H6YEU3_9AGAR|nr:hypothetical protein MVEN_01037200 [Mycena venus]
MSSESMLSVKLNSFSIARPASWTSLADWEVVQLELRLDPPRLVSTTGFFALEAATMLAPRLSTLDLILPDLRYVKHQKPPPIHVDDLAKSLRSVPCLRTLHLTNAYASLGAGRETPWIPSRHASKPQDTPAAISTALRWYMARIAQQVPALELVHITDEGEAGPSRSTLPWMLQVSCWVRVKEDGTRGVEMIRDIKLSTSFTSFSRTGRGPMITRRGFNVAWSSAR